MPQITSGELSNHFEFLSSGEILPYPSYFCSNARWKRSAVMGGQSDQSAAPLGYLAPLCVAVFFVCIWVAVGSRNRYFHNSIPPSRITFDPENPPPNSVNPSVITISDINNRFPLTVYHIWWTDRNHKLATTLPTTSYASDPSTRCDGSTQRAVGHHRNATLSDNPSDDLSNSSKHHYEDVKANAALSTSDTRSMCAICMEWFDTVDVIRPLTCGHIFHSACVDPWLSRRQACCPLCKMSFSRCRRQSEEETIPNALAIPVLPGIAMVRNTILPHRG
ncbi:putative RING finger protein [Aspergillus tanneri]|uniref:RING-type E3 ubiquitin transferase n=1 Tax=Aspergillus tanneri TaxID=1220188 RepID=A0A5M9MVP7_9EURO|nr:uncharacterized protein ATNIH1004_004843 [Aspergillus tanneri]KAA8648953.1 hypothetical protein ATNIH1004_004843 [Aspergillus tanneri]